MSENIFNKWQVYCQTESQTVVGYLSDTNGIPLTCFNNNEHTIVTSQNKILEKIYTDYTPKLNYWKIYCDTEQTYTYGYLDSKQTAENCFHNINHIVSKKPELLEIYTNNTVRIKEEYTNTNGNLQLDSHTFDIPAGITGSIIDYESSYPYPINMISLTFCPSQDNIGDTISADVGHHTTIGILTENISSGITGGTTGFSVSQTVIDHLNLGYLVTLTNGVTSCEMGRCVKIDKNHSRISTEFPTTTNFSANSTYVQQTVEMVKNLHFPSSTLPIDVGDDKIGSSYVPTNIKGRIRYKNNNGLAKKFTFYIEYLY